MRDALENWLAGNPPKPMTDAEALDYAIRILKTECAYGGGTSFGEQAERELKRLRERDARLAGLEE